MQKEVVTDMEKTKKVGRNKRFHQRAARGFNPWMVMAPRIQYRIVYIAHKKMDFLVVKILFFIRAVFLTPFFILQKKETNISSKAKATIANDLVTGQTISSDRIQHAKINKFTNIIRHCANQHVSIQRNVLSLYQIS